MTITRYDLFERVVETVDHDGNVTTVVYEPCTSNGMDGNTGRGQLRQNHRLGCRAGHPRSARYPQPGDSHYDPEG